MCVPTYPYLPYDLTMCWHSFVGQLVTLDDASRWAAGGLMVGLLGTLAAQRVAKSRKKGELMFQDVCKASSP